MSLAGICGAHRVGKSTLAQEYVKRTGAQYVQSPATQVYRDLGLSTETTHDFETRLMVQEEILRRLDAAYAALDIVKPAVADRTPIDLLMYTLADVDGGKVPVHLEERLQRYITDCIGCINKRLSLLLLVQPGIPVVYEEGKASLSPGYIEHCNSLALGLVTDERIRPAHFYIPRAMVDLGERTDALALAIRKTTQRAVAEREGMTLH